MNKDNQNEKKRRRNLNGRRIRGHHGIIDKALLGL
jgi:hypothetical protein